MQLMDRALQPGVNKSFIAPSALSSSVVKTIKVLMAGLSYFKSFGRIDPQLSL